jgi:hypothetical protein
MIYQKKYQSSIHQYILPIPTSNTKMKTKKKIFAGVNPFLTNWQQTHGSSFK